jgi:hypothetical protein
LELDSLEVVVGNSHGINNYRGVESYSWRGGKERAAQNIAIDKVDN